MTTPPAENSKTGWRSAIPCMIRKVMTIAVIEIGSKAVRLLIATRNERGEIKIDVSRNEPMQIKIDKDSRGKDALMALAPLLRCVGAFRREVGSHDVKRLAV